jgi:hypothetical protein
VYPTFFVTLGRNIYNMFKYFIYFFFDKIKYTPDDKLNKCTDYRKKYITTTKFNFQNQKLVENMIVTTGYPLVLLSRIISFFTNHYTKLYKKLTILLIL